MFNSVADDPGMPKSIHADIYIYIYERVKLEQRVSRRHQNPPSRISSHNWVFNQTAAGTLEVLQGTVDDNIRRQQVINPNAAQRRPSSNAEIPASRPFLHAPIMEPRACRELRAVELVGQAGRKNFNSCGGPWRNAAR